MTVEQIKQQMSINNTLKFMVIQVQRMAASADIIGRGDQIIELDTLRAQVDKLGIIGEESLGDLRNLLDTQEMPAVVMYDADGNEVDTTERSA